jgi:hypothetical protein
MWKSVQEFVCCYLVDSRGKANRRIFALCFFVNMPKWLSCVRLSSEAYLNFVMLMFMQAEGQAGRPPPQHDPRTFEGGRVYGVLNRAQRGC